MSFLRTITRDRFSYFDTIHITIGGILVWEGHPFWALAIASTLGFVSGVVTEVVSHFSEASHDR
ncbi:hypothetical protein FHW37_104506 [Neorhizobium alkalisoli]|uniref:Uncharacterized protein n=1 Tax=Neorhizobium alkalisoli TaxID=528178 RepID=A0A561QS65_9HYPH|nr:hypothetical protein FHW37_104506 [Neorhizobium alkalisoli]